MMDYQTIRAQVLALLQQEKRVAYRVLKRQFQRDEAAPGQAAVDAAARPEVGPAPALHDPDLQEARKLLEALA